MEHVAFQDQIAGNHCWGCGRDNPQGFRIKSYWDGDETICSWTPQPWHCASPVHVVNGGVLATLIDCHAILSAMAHANRLAGYPLDDTARLIWYVTGQLEVTYQQPTPLGPTLDIRARLLPQNERKTVVQCTLSVAGTVCASGNVLAVRVPSTWMQSQG